LRSENPIRAVKKKTAFLADTAGLLDPIADIVTNLNCGKIFTNKDVSSGM
jgi:hypothetical protein